MIRARGTALSTVALLALALSVGACSADGAKKRAIGATCATDGQCTSGLCLASTCLDPERDDDGDGLVNRVEGALGTNALAADTDGDGIPDDVEIGPDIAHPLDEDGDGKPDAVESSSADADHDCVPDQRDGDDATPEGSPSVVADLACCCEGSCSKHGHIGVSATCTGEGDARVLTCSPAQADLDGDGTRDPCDPDRDGDGVDNDVDVCPDASDPEQADGDGDGLGDACDPEDDRLLRFTTEEVATYCQDACDLAANGCGGQAPVADCASKCAADVAGDAWWLASYFCLELGCDPGACGLGDAGPPAEDPRCPAACDAIMPCELPEVTFPSRDYCRARCTAATLVPSEPGETIACAAALPDFGGQCDFFALITCFPEYDVCAAVCAAVAQPLCQPGAPVFASWPDAGTCEAACGGLDKRRQVELLGCQLARGCSDFPAVCDAETLPSKASAGCKTLCDAWFERCGPNELLVHRDACAALCDGARTGVDWVEREDVAACVRGLERCPEGDAATAALIGCTVGTSPRCAAGCQTVATCAAELQVPPPEDCEASCTALSLQHPERLEAVVGCVEAGHDRGDCGEVVKCLQPPLDETVCAAACDHERACGDGPSGPECPTSCRTELRPPSSSWSTKVCETAGSCVACEGLDQAPIPAACEAACAASPDTCVAAAYGICAQVCQGMLAALGQERGDELAPCVVDSLGPSCDLDSAISCRPLP